MIRKKFLQSCIHSWLNLTGKTIDISKRPELQGPMGYGDYIGEDYFKILAHTEGLSHESVSGAGLLTNFLELVDPADPHRNKLDPGVKEFYEHTAKFSLEVWFKWSSVVSWLAKLIIKSISAEIMQLNIPLDSLDTSYGMSSEIIHLKKGTETRYVCWLRKSKRNNRVVYAGFYSSYQLHSGKFKHVRVVFPLPHGNVTVILRMQIHNDGSITLTSDHNKFRGTGYYRIHKNARGGLKVQKLPIHETIHVFRDKEGILRTDHFFSWWNIPFLKLHYKIIPKS